MATTLAPTWDETVEIPSWDETTPADEAASQSPIPQLAPRALEATQPIQFTPTTETPFRPEEPVTPPPFTEEAPVAAKMAFEQAQKPFVPIPRLKINPDDDWKIAAGKEVVNFVAGIPEFFESVLGLVTIPVAAAKPTLTAAAFGADMLKNLGQQVAATVKGWKEMTPAQRAVALTDMAGTGALAGLLGRSAYKGIKGPKLQVQGPIPTGEILQTPRGVLPSEIKPTPTEVQNAEAIRGNQGQLRPPGEVIREGQGIGRENVEQVAPVQPQPVVAGEVAQAAGVPEALKLPAVTPEQIAQFESIGADTGFRFDGIHQYPGIKPLLSFTFKNVPKDDPVYGATFNLPIDSTPEQVLRKAEAKAREFAVAKEKPPVVADQIAAKLAEQKPPETPNAPEPQPQMPQAQTPPPPVPRPEPAVAVKEPWETTKAEWFKHKWSQIPKRAQKSILAGDKGFVDADNIRQQADREHQRNVERALSEGKPVPPEVLADYPNLKRRPPLPAAAKVEAPVAAASKVQNEIQSVARTEGQRPAKEVKSELVAKLEQAIQDAPTQQEFEAKYPWEQRTGDVRRWKKGMTVTITIPGDGDFTVAKHKEALGEILKRAKRISVTQGKQPSIPIIKETKLGLVNELDMERLIRAYGGADEAAKRMRSQSATTSEEVTDAQKYNAGAFADALEQRVLLAKNPNNQFGENWAKLDRLRTALEQEESLLEDAKSKAAGITPEEVREYEYAGKELKRWREAAKHHANQAKKWEAAIVEMGEEPRPKPTQPEPEPQPVGMGGAVPAEFRPVPQSPTAMKYNLIDQERQERGLPPLAKPESVSDATAMAKATAKLDQDPEFADRLIREINSGNKKVIEDWENHVLMLRKIDVRNEYAKSAREAIQAYEDGRLEDMNAANARTLEWSNRLEEVEKASRLSGSARGRALRSLQVMANEDFSLASLELQKRAARGGKPITPQERVELSRIADEYKAKADALESQMATRNAVEIDKAVQEALARVAAEAKQAVAYHPKVLEMAETYAKKWDQLGQKALAELKSMMAGEGQLFSGGINPEAFDRLVIYGTSKLVRGTVNLAKWTDLMVRDFGEKFRPWAQRVYDASQTLLDSDLAKSEKGFGPRGKEVAKQVKSDADLLDKYRARIEKRLENEKDISWFVRGVARVFYKQGITDRETMVNRLHQFMSDIDPQITRREVAQAFSGYGDFKPLSKDNITVALRGMKGELQQLLKLEDMAKGQPPLKSGAERRTPTEAERQLIKKVNEAKYAFQVPMTDPATQLKSALDTYKTNLKNRIADYEQRIKVGDFSRPTRRELQLDKTALGLRHDMEVIRRKFHEMLIKDKLANQDMWQRAGRFLGEIINTTRALKASVDLSATLRQGGIIVGSHPIRGAKVMPDQLKALRSAKEQFRVEQEILARPNYRLYERSGLSLTEHGQKLSQMEEAYMSRWAEHIPGVAASQRAYTVFLNKLRADSFDSMADWVTRKGQTELTVEEGRIIANYINVATGRGNFGLRENALVGLNTVFFAPRLVASRFQFLAGQPIYHGLFSGKAGIKGTLRARALVAGEYARFLAAAGTVYALASMAGFQIELDPRSSDFLKIRVGNTRIDPLAGLIQASVLMSRLASGKTKTQRGEIVPIRGLKVPYGTGNSADVMARFLRTKLSPAFGTTVDVLTGKNVVGQPVTPATTIQNLVVPLSLGDIYTTMKEQGVPTGSALAMAGLLGIGLQTYQQKPAPEPPNIDTSKLPL